MEKNCSNLSFEIIKLPIYHNISKTANNIILIKKV